MRLGLIISNDWELYGDGSGDFYEVQYKPTEELLKTCEKHDVKLTLMAEVGQQWAYKKLGKTEKWALDIAKAWESQLRDVVKRGHDVQLHFHPQWFNATFTNDNWVLDTKYSVFSSLPQREQENILEAGKEYLENLLRPVNPEYSCIGFRAGALSTEPYKNLVHSLLNVGILADTSVTDSYRNARSHFKPWFMDSSNIKVQEKTDTGLLEIPIYSIPIIDSPILRKTFLPNFIYKYNFGLTLSKREKTWIKSRNKEMLKRYSLSQRPAIRDNITNVKWILSQIITRGCLRLDYVSIPASIFVNILQKLAEKVEHDCPNRRQPLSEFRSGHSQDDKEYILPVMASGHVKSIITYDNINLIFEKIKSKFGEKVIFWTFSDAIRYWINFSPRGQIHSF